MGTVANMGVPMIGIYWPPMWLALVPIIVVEAWFARRTLGGGWRRALGWVGLANAISTLIGVPVAWTLWAGLQLAFFGSAQGLDTFHDSLYAATVQAAWLMPYERSLFWLIPAAALALTVVFAALSIVIEGLVVRFAYRRSPVRAVARWAWRAHAITYAGVWALVVACLYLPRSTLGLLPSAPVEFVIDVAWRIGLLLH